MRAIAVSLLCILSLSLLLVSCSEEPNPAEPVTLLATPATLTPPSTPTTYIEQGDLEKIRQHGTLRLLAPRFDGADALPRQGISIQNYQHIAEAFADHLQLNVQWIYIDEFAELIPSLLRGDGDLIVTNMTVTQPRLKLVQFSRAINKINEVLVTRNTDVINTTEQLAGLSLSIPAGTAYIDTLNSLANKQQLSINMDIVSSDTSDSDLLSAIQDGEMQATVLDSDIASNLLLDYPELSVSLTLKRHRDIAWATRKNSTNLLNQLNEFLVSHHLQASVEEQQQRDWPQIQQHGRLRMLTLNNPASYFMWRGELMGFDMDLMQKFAKTHKLHLSVILKDSIKELITALQQGEGDVIAASLTQSPQREAMGLQFSSPYLKIKEQLVGRGDGPSVTSLEQLAGKNIGVNPDTVFYSRFKRLQSTGVALKLLEFPKTSTEMLIDKLLANEFDFTATDSHLLAIESAHRDNLKVNFTLGEESNIAWALRTDQTQLVEKLNTFIKKEYRGLFYNVTYNKYFKNNRKMQQHQADRVVAGAALSPFDDVIKPLAKQHGMDWRLIVAQMYQESKFDPKAKSFAGAQGLMQVMPRTAKEMGFSDLYIPENGINAGITYMKWLEARFPGELALQERIFFTLASYNAGAGHVRDARRLADRLGKDANRWFGHVEDAMLLLAKPEYYKQARFGYVRGSEPVQYVKSIRARYLGYLQVH